jgi:hypothetical protein
MFGGDVRGALPRLARRKPIGCERRALTAGKLDVHEIAVARAARGEVPRQQREQPDLRRAGPEEERRDPGRCGVLAQAADQQRGP